MVDSSRSTGIASVLVASILVASILVASILVAVSSDLRDEASEGRVLLLDESNILSELGDGRVINDLLELDISSGLDFSLETVTFASLLAEGGTERGDFLLDGLLFATSIGDSGRIRDVSLLEEGDLLAQSFVLRLEFSELTRTSLEVSDLSAGDMLSASTGVERHVLGDLVNFKNPMDFLKSDRKFFLHNLLTFVNAVNNLLVDDINDLFARDALDDAVDGWLLDDLLDVDGLGDLNVLFHLDDRFDLVRLLLNALLDLRNLDDLLDVNVEVELDGSLHNALLRVRGILVFDLGQMMGLPSRLGFLCTRSPGDRQHGSGSRGDRPGRC